MIKVPVQKRQMFVSESISNAENTSVLMNTPTVDISIDFSHASLSIRDVIVFCADLLGTIINVRSIILLTRKNK